MRIKRDEQAVPLSFATYRQLGAEQRRSRADRDAYDDGTMTGFVLGVAAATLGWLILSGQLLEMVAVAVHAAFGLGRPA